MWASFDLAAHNILDDIVERIRTADMCLFDNLGTLNRPNVYVEVGMAYALKRPMIVCECAGRGRLKGSPDTGSVPSDLAGMLTLRYTSYEDMCRKLYFNLPSFLKRFRL